MRTFLYPIWFKDKVILVYGKGSNIISSLNGGENIKPLLKKDLKNPTLPKKEISKLISQLTLIRRFF